MPHIDVWSDLGHTETDDTGRFVAPASGGHHDACLLFTVQSLDEATVGTPAGGDYAWQQWTPPSGNCAEHTTGEIRIVMHPGADVFGTVRDAGGNPAKGVPVLSTISQTAIQTPYIIQQSFRTLTDSQGRYRIYGLQPGAATTLSLYGPVSNYDMGPIGFGAKAGSGTPIDVTDYGEQCDTYFPSPSCPNASPSATPASTPTAVASSSVP